MSVNQTGYDSDEDDLLQVYGDDDLTLDPAQIPSLESESDVSEDMELEEGEIEEDLPRPPPPPPPDDVLPPPPPPPGLPPAPPHIQPTHPKSTSSRPPTARNPYLEQHYTSKQPILPTRRWAKYDTALFDSDRLRAFTTARPLPLGM